METSANGLRVLVTAGGAGIGRVIARTFVDHGARVLAHRYWQPREQLVLTEFVGGFHVDAEVIYCQRLDGNQCAVGLKFATAIESEWPAAGGSFGMRSRTSS